MKNLLKSMLVLGALATLIAQGASWEEIKKKGTLRVATEGNFAPFNFYKDNKLVGFEIDVVEAIAKKHSLKVDWKTGGFDSLLIGLDAKLNRYDLVAASHGITPERANVVDFSEAHYCTGVVVVSKKGGPKSLNDLKGKKAAIQVGTIFAPTLAKVQGIAEVKTYPKDPDCLQALKAGRVDSWVTDKLVAIEALKTNPKDGLEIGDTVLVEKVAMAVAKGNTDILKQINEGLAAIQKDGTYKSISQKYFNEDISCH